MAQADWEVRLERGWMVGETNKQTKKQKKREKDGMRSDFNSLKSKKDYNNDRSNFNSLKMKIITMDNS